MTQEKINGNQSEKIKADELVIVSHDEFPALNTNPFDGIDKDLYKRIECLTSWFVLRAPLIEVTRLAKPGLISTFKANEDSEKGSRALNRKSFDESFLIPCNIDCTCFDFIYTRRGMRPSLIDLNLNVNDERIFKSEKERAVCFVGKNSKGKENSCIESVCLHIRNALAHGRIALKKLESEPFLFLEDGQTPRNIDHNKQTVSGLKLEVRFRMVIKVSTLEKWHSILADEKTNTETNM